jgi:isoleucyl-tRNA synthetase
MEHAARTGRPVRLSDKWMLMRRTLDKIWNIYTFFVNYANIDGFDPKQHTLPVAERAEIDRWIISELHLTIRAVTEGLESYDTERPATAIQDFLENLSNWYVRRNRKRFYTSGMDTDKVAAYLTLYECLTTLLTLLAPFLPFTTEELYQNLVRNVDENAPLSVHLCDWPQVDESLIDEKLTRETHLVLLVVGLGHSARKGIKVRQPLSALHVRVTNPSEEEALERLKGLVLEELNIKQLNLMSADNDMLAYTLKPQVKILGPKYGPLVQKILARFKALDAHGANEAARQIQTTGKLSFTLEGQQVELSASEVEVVSTARPGFVTAEERGYVVALDTVITPALREEGLVRDLTHYIQDMRKKAGFKIEDHIALRLETDQELASILEHNRATLQAETLADTLTIVTEPAQAPAINEAYREKVAPDEAKKLENFTFEVVLGRV